MQFAERLQHRLSSRSSPLQLQRRNLYILPTVCGGLWLLLIGITYLIGIQMRSNGPVLLSFLLLALLLLSPFLTHRNLEGLELRCLPAAPGYADAPIGISLELKSSIERPAVKFRWLSASQGKSVIHHLPQGTTRLDLAWQPLTRGLHAPGRLFIHTTAPFGLFRCWSYWETPLEIWVAPSREAGPVVEIRRPINRQVGQAVTATEGSEHFRELSPLRPEEGLQRVAWKIVARGQGWYGKRFSGEQPSDRWLALAPGLPLESALKHLCDRLCRGLRDGERFGLLLPGGVEVPPGLGERHHHACLRALASVPIDAHPSNP